MTFADYGMDLSDTSHNVKVLLQMIAFFGIYLAFYKIVRKSRPAERPEYCCRIVTFVHGLFCCFFALYYIVLPAVGSTKITSIPSTMILTHSMGYFTFDLLWCSFYGETKVMLFHHLLTCTGLVYYSFKFSKQYYIVYALGLTELTNPFLQVRYFLKHHGMREGLIFKFVENMLILLFYLIRVAVLTYYTYLGYTSVEMDFDKVDLTFTTLGLCTGYALAFQMFMYIRHQMKKNQQKADQLKTQ